MTRSVEQLVNQPRPSLAGVSYGREDSGPHRFHLFHLPHLPPDNASRRRRPVGRRNHEPLPWISRYARVTGVRVSHLQVSLLPWPSPSPWLSPSLPTHDVVLEPTIRHPTPSAHLHYAICLLPVADLSTQVAPHTDIVALDLVQSRDVRPEYLAAHSKLSRTNPASKPAQDGSRRRTLSTVCVCNCRVLSCTDQITSRINPLQARLPQPNVPPRVNTSQTPGSSSPPA
ncbi:hypothetical protein BGZ61DRAFT_547298 [Ilyonectria robusta]|uniref:uncharacterized protein n=1 Tax=Ilyonectria robusta TaxID=1079257 RepID=UPI001E8D9863|nr:uncharacterized protein BGZ61DRAFT_547298 [Ilyonectria robusta]KAH8686773.1 hypothetical protein BGZ61DRAFT_547298 [Ilyonectria robusta]